MALTASEVLFHMCGYVSTSPLKAANSPVTAVTSPFAVLVMFSTDSGSGRVEAQGEHAKGTFGWDLGGHGTDVCAEDLWNMEKGR